MVCTLSKWPPPMVSLVLRLAWSERQHGVHRVTQFPVNTPPYIGFYAMSKHVAIALRQFFELRDGRGSRAIVLYADGLREKEGEKKQRVGEGPGGGCAVKDEENERHNAWTARY
ncbi:hypothetical protein ALC56_06536 [Trachymyrmex septentrionalis]|uniref:Uncharacterized protein n=1 Tax=Trachymyrmex septentrionalis TaxID=34720 RepID=A0A195FEK3_9HYME|nr:hypothetical protein ALC56_06536 [Trachymyrmex septentrionalis]